MSIALNAKAAKTPEISVVIASRNMGRSLERCLQTLLRQGGERPVEWILVDGSDDGSAAVAAAAWPEIRLLRCPPGTLVPELWQAGIEASAAPLVALTIAQCLPGPDWLNQIADSLKNGAAAVGGPLRGPSKGSRLDWALYFSRYSGWMPAGRPAGPIDDLAGDNAAYRREAIMACRDAMAAGFWENLVNARLVERGETLLWNPRMVTEFAVAEPLGDLLRVRFRHGRHYASTRPGSVGAARLLRFLAAPLLVPVLMARIASRVRQNRPDWLPALRRSALPLTAILLAWSAGEASGYARPLKLKMEFLGDR